MAFFGSDYDRPYRQPDVTADRAHRMGGYGPSSIGGAYDPGTRPVRYGYGGDYRGSPQRGYDGGFKSQWRTDHGDPFGDRSRGTPFRMTRGEFEPRDRDAYGRGGYDRGEYRGRYRDTSGRRGYDHGWWW